MSDGVSGDAASLPLLPSPLRPAFPTHILTSLLVLKRRQHTYLDYLIRRGGNNGLGDRVFGWWGDRFRGGLGAARRDLWVGMGGVKEQVRDQNR